MSDGAELQTWTSRRSQAPERTPVVLVHGGPGLWDYLGPVDALLDDVAVVHRYDQRGCGRSSPSADLSMARYIADIEELRRHWGDEKLVLIGHSFGATLALAYAGTHPEHAAAVGYLSGVGIGDWKTPFRGEVARRRAAFGLNDRLAELEARPRTASEEVEWRRLVWATDYADTAVGLEASRVMAETPLPINHLANRRLAPFTDGDQLSWAARVSCPVYVVHGSADPRPARHAMALATEIPQARQCIIEDAGHLPWVECPDEVRRVLHEVIRATSSQRAAGGSTG